MRRWFTLVVVVVISSGLIATAANSKEGVYFDDPDSPGGKEYSLPHDKARRDTSPGGGSRGPRGSVPRFGAGVTIDRSGSKGAADGTAGDKSGDGVGGVDRASNTKRSGRDGDQSNGGVGGFGGGDSASGAAGNAAGVDLAGTASGGSPNTGLSAIAAGVLLVGGALGLMLRKLPRQD